MLTSLKDPDAADSGADGEAAETATAACTEAAGIVISVSGAAATAAVEEEADAGIHAAGTGEAGIGEEGNIPSTFIFLLILFIVISRIFV